MANTTIQAISAAVLSKLKADLGTLAYYVEEANPEVSSLEEFLNSVQLPAIAVGYAGSDFDNTEESGEVEQESGTIAVIVITDDFRGYITAMNEPAGISTILKKCGDSLFGETLGLPLMTGLRRQSQRPLTAVPGRVAWQQIWEVTFNSQG